MGDGLPLPTLLSQALVAFIIEFDNEFEHRMPHRTTMQGKGQGPWLASMAMWSTCMRFVGEEGVTVRELEALARAKTNLNGMVRWGYVKVEDGLIRATSKGRMAREVWRPLFDVIEKRWEGRFGEDAVERLRESLRALIRRFDMALPDCLPILRYGLFSRGPAGGREEVIDSGLTLPALLSRALLAFAIEFERESELSLAICANVVRVLNEEGVRVRDLPLLSGVSKEAIRMALGFLMKKRLVVIEPEKAGSRTKVVRFTPKGLEAQEAYRKLLADIEDRWRERFGDNTIRELRESLELNLFPGLEPYPDNWRAAVQKPETLPHYPMVLHRGGFPDGS